MTPADETYALLRECPYAVLDPISIETYPEDLSSTPLVPLWLKVQASQLPLLTSLSDLSTEKAARLLEHFDHEIALQNAPSIRLLIFSDASTQMLRQHLIDRMTTRHRGRRALLRYYDPRVMLQLSWMLTPGQLASLFGPINRMVGWVTGKWHVFAKPNEADDSTLPDMAMLERIGPINEVLAGLEEQFDAAQIIALSRRIDSALGRAEARGLGESDRIAFANHVISVHPEFDKHPRVAALLDSVDSESTYRDAARLLDQNEWERIRADLHAGNFARMAP